jgi:hypothetical protein
MTSHLIIIFPSPQPGLKLLKPFSGAAHEKPAVLKTDGDTPIVADFRYFPDFISQSEFAFPRERFGKEFDPITYLETVPFHLAFAFRPSSTSRRMASARDGLSSCFANQSSSAASGAGCMRTTTWTPMPVGAGPRFFFASTVCFLMKTVLAQKQAEGKVALPHRL